MHWHIFCEFAKDLSTILLLIPLLLGLSPVDLEECREWNGIVSTSVKDWKLSRGRCLWRCGCGDVCYGLEELEKLVRGVLRVCKSRR